MRSLLLALFVGISAPIVITSHPILALADQTQFSSWDEATRYVRSHYEAETVDTSKSSWITSAEYYEAEGEGYLILGMNGKPYIFRGVPPAVWEGFKKADSFGSYYQAHIKGRYYFKLN